MMETGRSARLGFALVIAALTGGVGCGDDAPANGGAVNNADAALDAASDAPSQDVVDSALADAAGDIAVDVQNDVTVDATVDVATDVAREAAADGSVDAAAEATVDASPDVAVDVSPDVAADVSPDVAADVSPDVAADVSPDVAVDAGPVCVSPRVVCGDRCVDVATDDANCGACGRVCAGGGRCAAGVCPPADPNFSGVALLLHMNGASGSTTFTDVRGHVVTAADGAQISTTASRFGGASGYFDGMGANLTTAPLPEFDFSGAAPFTIETWVNGTGTVFSCDSYGLLMSIKEGRTLYVWINGLLPWDFVGTAAGTVPVGWHHVALTYDATTYRVFIDGAQTFAVAGRLAAQSNSYLIIGGYQGGTQPWFDGYLDDFRVTRGVARYVSPFAAPTAAFPDL